MAKKNFVNTALVVAAIFVIGAGYFFLIQKTASTNQPTNNPTNGSPTEGQSPTTTDTTPVATPVQYTNAQYGFRFSLPASWAGYSIVSDQWQGNDFNSPGNKVIAQGPIISIRHPQWTTKQPRQDIPIMVLTISQWDALQQDKFHIGAAPIGPRELGRNANYVFALPARYNYAFPVGYEEVNALIESGSLQAF